MGVNLLPELLIEDGNTLTPFPITVFVIVAGRTLLGGSVTARFICTAFDVVNTVGGKQRRFGVFDAAA